MELTKKDLLAGGQLMQVLKMAESSPNGWKRLWEKEKLLVTSNFSFSPTVFCTCSADT